MPRRGEAEQLQAASRDSLEIDVTLTPHGVALVTAEVRLR